MSEDEAKKTKCWRTLGTARVGECVGSACMAWRWDREGWSLKFDEHGPVLARNTADAHGYCGLAAKP